MSKSKATMRDIASAAEVSVTTMPDNQGAIRFYKRHGLVDEAVFLEKHFERLPRLGE